MLRLNRPKPQKPGGAIIGFGLFTAFAAVWIIGFYLQESRLDHERDWPIVTAKVQRAELRREERLWLCLHVTFDWQGRPIKTSTRPPKEDPEAPTGNYAELAQQRDRLRPGQSIELHVDPANPTVVARPGRSSTKWIGVAFGSIFLLVGLWGLRGAWRWRRSGSERHLSPRRGTKVLICALFFIAMGVFGVVALWKLSITTLQQWQQAKAWPATSCTVVDQWRQGAGKSSSFEVLYEYQWQGRRYRSDQRSLMGSADEPRGLRDKYAIGSTHTCYVDPTNPNVALLDRNLGFSALLMFFPIPFLVVGVGGVISMARRFAAGRPLIDT